MSVFLSSSENSESTDALPWVVIPLLKGVVHRQDDESRWQSLLTIQARVRDYVAVLNLRLEINESEGYAFLRSRPVSDESPEDRLPQLISRRPLSYGASLVLALLRKRLLEFDAAGGGPRLIMARDDIMELVRVYFPETSNEVQLRKRLNVYLNQIVGLGFLRRLETGGPSIQSRYEVQRIIMDFVNAQWLGEFGNRIGAGSAEGTKEDDVD